MRKPQITGPMRASYNLVDGKRRKIDPSDPEERVRRILKDTWGQAKQRCYNPKHRKFKNYGGRGIGMCPEWRFSFQRFYEDMRPSWREGGTLDRVNVNDDYSFKNCRWSSLQEQASNRTSNLWIECPDGQRRIQIKAAHTYDLPSSTLDGRRARGIPHAEWFKPVDTRRYKRLHPIVPPTDNLVLSVPNGWPDVPAVVRGSLRTSLSYKACTPPEEVIRSEDGQALTKSDTTEHDSGTP